MRSFLLPLLCVAACGRDTAKPPPAKPIPELAQRVADAIGVDAWRKLGRLSFTWTHLPSGRVRAYEWRPRDGFVEVRVGTPEDGQSSIRIPSGPLPAGAPQDQVSAHQAWVNDIYWLMLPLLALDDGSELRAIPETEVPGLPALGKLRALDVRYAKGEGYTGGDRYVVYVGKDDLPVAWAFHKGGAEEPTLVTTRAVRQRANGISFPTRFEKADGTTFIEISDLSAE